MSFAAEVPAKDFISIVRRAASVQAKTTIPILEHAMLVGTGNTLSIHGTNLDQAVTATCECDAQGSVTASATRLMAIAATLEKNESVQLKANGTAELSIEQGRSRYKLPTLPVEDFPTWPENPQRYTVRAPAPELLRSLRALLGTVSVDKSRFYLMGVYFDARNGALVATNGNSLGADPAPWLKSDRSGFILPSDAVKPVCDLLATVDTVEILADLNSATFATPSVKIQTKFIAAEFPDWQRVVPRSFNSEFHVKRADIQNALVKMLALGKGDEYGAKIRIDFGDELAFSSCNVADGATAQAACPAKIITGKPLSAAYGSRFLRWVMDSLDGEETIALRLIDGDSAMVAVPLKDAETVRVVMPQRLT